MATSTIKPKSKRESKEAATEKASGRGARRARTPRRANDTPAIASPAAAGPSGALLEGHVGAQYLLPLLSGGEARGLPGVVVTRVAFQRAGLNHPMDDVIVTGHDRQGLTATLELQAKRTIAFTASDEVFADVVALACRAAAKPEFSASPRYELAVAIARTSTKIEQHIQEVLKWAREYQDAEGFFGRLNQPGAAHEAMRNFVAAFRAHMERAGAAHDEAAVLRLLSRFQVLAFDFEQPGSVCAQLARERCALQLAPQDAGRAGELWDTLQQIALHVNAAGGELDAATLRERLTSKRGYRLTGDRRLHVARERLADIAESTLADIGTTVHGVTIDRGGRVGAGLSALEQGRYLEIRGAGGVGKSGVLKDIAQRVAVESRVIVVAPHRVPGGGWAALAAQLGCEVSAREFLTDLAGDGGGTLFVDGIDRFDDFAQRATVKDLLRAASQVNGFRVVATARLDFDADARAWLPAQVLQTLGEAPPLVIDELEDNEVTQLANADPALAALLMRGHPAEKLVRNLYRLDRLARSATPKSAAPFTEAQMSLQWWTTGDGESAMGPRLERRRVLRALAVHSLSSSESLDAGTLSTAAIAGLNESGSLRLVSAVRVEPAHDVLRDWAVGCLLYEEPGHIATIDLASPAPMRLVRGMELTARLHAETGSDVTAWRALLHQVSVAGAHGSWRRAVLLALVRTERADDVLNKCLPELAAGNAELLDEVVRAAIVVDSQSGVPFWKALGLDTSKLTDDFVRPHGPAWLNLVDWSLVIGDRLPHAAIPRFVDLYSRWCTAYAGLDPRSPLLVARLYGWLVEVEAKNHPNASDFKAWMTATEAPGISMTTAQENDLRAAFLMWSKLRPAETELYLQGIAAHPHPHVLFRQLLPFVGTAPYAAPRAMADLFLQVLPKGDNEKDERGAGTRDVFSVWDLDYFPASPARAPFFDLLMASKEHGLRLSRGVVAHAIQRRSRGRDPGTNCIVVPLPNGTRSFPWCQSYMWSRSHDSYVAASALMALEAWAHTRIERGDSVQEVLDDILGPEGSPAANLLVAVDVMLSHWPKTRECLWPFAASARLLAMDRQRLKHDLVNGKDTRAAWVRPEPAGAVKLDSLLGRPSRRIPLDAVLSQYGHYGPADTREAMMLALREEAVRIGPPDAESRGMADPRFAAMSALNQLDPANYVSKGEDERGQPVVEYVPPNDEARLLAKFQKDGQRGSDEVAIRMGLMQALTERACPEQLLMQGLHWAMSDTAILQTDLDKDEQEWINRTRYIVAALVMRDGSRDLKATQGAWAREQLTEAAMREPDRTGPVKQLPYNPAAIAAVGFVGAYRDNPESGDLPPLLRLAARHDTNMVAVLRADLTAQRPLRAELTRSLVRLGLISSIYAVRQRVGDDYVSMDDYRAREQALKTARDEAEQARLQNAVSAEQQWLAGDGLEPGWPELPNPKPPKERRRISLGKARARQKPSPAPSISFELDAAAAASWLSLAVELWRQASPERLCALVQHCWPWTAGANGVGCGPDEEPGELAHEWNSSYFTAALVAGVATDGSGVATYVLARLAQLPEERFFDAAEAVLHTLDSLWLNDRVVSDTLALSIREALAQRLSQTKSWSRLVSERSVGIGIHVGGAVAALFMGQHVLGQGPRCYVLPPAVTRADLLLPMLTQLAEQAAGSTFVAIAYLGLLEIKPHMNQLIFITRAVEAWWRAQGANTEFWIDYRIGRRLCAWIDKAVLADPASTLFDSRELTAVVDILIKCGTPAAVALEERVAARVRTKRP